MHRNRFLFPVVVALLCGFTLAVQAQDISTIAGGGPPNGIAATTAPMGLPWDIVQDGAGNSYISDNFSNRIFKVDSSGNFSVIAGTGLSNETGDGGPAIAATLSSPEGIALDTTSNVNTKGALYIADTGNKVIRVVNTNSSGNITLFNGTGAIMVVQPGNIAVIAGEGSSCTTAPSCGDGGLPSAAQLTAPGGVAVDPVGNLLIADTGDSVIREVFINSGSVGTIQLVAGNYTACSAASCGDGSSPTSAELTLPGGVLVDAAGDFMIADTGDSTIRVVNNSGAASFFGVAIASGKIGTVAGQALVPCTTAPLCGDGTAAVSAKLNTPTGLFYGGSNLWIADTGNVVLSGQPAQQPAVREVSSGGTISLVAGDYVSCSAAPCGNGGNPLLAQLASPTGVFVDTAGDVLIADQQDDAIREVSKASGDISTFAGIVFNESYYGNPVSGTSAELDTPDGVAIDSEGNVYIADTSNDVIRKLGTTGTISTVAGIGTSCSPTDLPCGNGAAATSALLTNPQGTFVDANGNIYIADSGGNVIRVVNTQTTPITFNTSNPPTTIAPGDIGTVVASFGAGCPSTSCGDGGLATAAALKHPSAVFVNSAGTIYFTDTDDEVIRVVNTQAATIKVAGVSIAPGDIETIAGNYIACTPVLPATATTCGDGNSAINAHLNTPEGIFVDSAGDIYFADNLDFVIRKIDGTTGIITRIAGNYTSCSVLPCGNGSSAASAQFINPLGVWLDFSGNIFIADAGLSSIRAVNTQATSITIAADTIAPGDIDRVVATGIPGFAGDGGLAANAELDRPHGLAGDAAGDLFITDTGAQRVRKVTKLMATAPTATLSAGSLTFGDQAVGTTSVSQDVTITNNGNITSLTVSSVALSGTDAGDFKETNTCTSVAAGANCAITVSFTPTALGTRTATITITDTAGNPQVISLTGTATAAAASLSATTLTFSSQAVGTSSAAQTVTITNSGDVTSLTVSKVALSGTDAGDFKETNTCTSVAAGAKCTITVTFAPTATGSRTATITITDNAAGSSQTVSLTGTAVATFTLKAGTLSQASVSPGGSATSTITMTPGAGFTGTVTLACSITTTSTPAPTCSLSSDSLTAADPTSTLTIDTTANSSSMVSPATSGRSNPFYAMWLLLPAMLLSTAGLAVPSRRKLLSWLLIALVVGGCLFLVACGGGSSSGGGTGTGGTPSGTYTVTLTATTSGITGSVTTSVQLMVN